MGATILAYLEFLRNTVEGLDEKTLEIDSASRPVEARRRAKSVHAEIAEIPRVVNRFKIKYCI